MANAGSKVLATAPAAQGCAGRCDCPLLAALRGGVLNTYNSGAAFSSGVQHSLHLPLHLRM